jgi:hypothetical protein
MGTSAALRRRPPVLRTLTVLCAATLAVLLVGAAPASANTSRANTDSFSRSGTFLAARLQACVHYTISGKLTYLAKRYGPTALHMTERRLERITVVAPALSVRATRYDPGNHSCTSRPVRWTSIRATQGWAGYACNFHPSIGISAPFGVSAGFWPSCGSRTQGQWGHTFADRARSSVTLYSSSGRVRYGTQGLGLRPTGSTFPKPKCYGVTATFRLQFGGTADTVRSPKRQVCPTPRW